MVSTIQKFTDSTYFTNALKITISAVIPVLVFSYLGYFEIGFTLALGAFFTYPSDIQSNLKHKVNGILVTVFIVSGVNLIINLIHPYPWLFYPLLTVLIFILSMISVYGQRANMVSFSALLSISLAFAHLHTGWKMLEYSGLILLGGLFYLLVSLIFFYIKPNRYIELQIADCIRLTSKYLKLRGDLWELNSNRKDITKKQLELQVELNTIHENIREVLIRNRTNSGSSNQNRKMLIVFISLVEILELAISTSFDHNKLHQKFDDHPKVLKTYQNLAYNLASTLKKISKSIQERSQYVPKHNLINDLQKLEFAINHYENDLGKIEASEGVLMLTTMLHYAEKQVEKIKILERAFTSTINLQDFKGKDKDLEKFISPQYYPLSTLIENLSFSSTVFRHSIRLTITILAGLLIGQLLPFQNSYWIVLTIVVILRQGYGLTKQRTYERIFGTFLGVLIAFGMLSIIHNTTIIGCLAVISMLLGFSFTPTNYKVGATFVTLYVIFIYGILTPNIQDVIQYRILDTLVGATLSFLANHFLWPSWEFLNIPQHLKKSIEANKNYLKQISIFYNKKGDVSTSYRLARKHAFIEIGNLMASFQRMVQEPKSKQNKLPQVYKLTVLNHSLLSSAASLGTYIQSHKTTEASEAFNMVFDKVIENLESAIILLKEDGIELAEQTVSEELSKRFTELKNIRSEELKKSDSMNEEMYKTKMQEAQMVIEQLIWLTNLSENILKTTQLLLKS
ncbi:FUSC family protein [Flavobacterium granuli]|uniref:Membrane protein (TIGR01666 family) n=1 Tax=Flavobacterium granuli TaxID=280093 RepID=A0A1M5LLB4_9FLAO|nr:FUSC family membrane protein [Flavobacterium granuli]PRZ24022.1 putative membrane protein (TIGR01666 family) [Flavobacterium granuli]SHG65746.1 TIGR01666 family membrane protein [Flavobacterium granuli]